MRRRIYKYMRVNVLEIDTAREGYATRSGEPRRAELGLFESIWILLSLSYANLPWSNSARTCGCSDIRLSSQGTRRWMGHCSQMA